VRFPTISTMRRRHDPFLKLLYRAGARDAIALFFPNLADRIDWSQMQWIDKEVPIRGLRSRSVTADLVGSTRDVEGRYLKVLIHPELQMEPDAAMDWRVLQYNAGLLLQEADPGTRVLTFVFYHCAGVGGIQKRRSTLDFYEESLHHVTYWSVGLGELDAEIYAQSMNPMAWALTAWMRQQRQGRAASRLRLQEKILRLVPDEWYRGLLLDTVRTYFRLNRREEAEEERLLRSADREEVADMIQTEMGRIRLETLRQALLQVIRSRFPGAPDAMAERVARVRSQDRLNVLIKQAAVANSLEEIEQHLGR
jgi:hypothetical protein